MDELRELDIPAASDSGVDLVALSERGTGVGDRVDRVASDERVVRGGEGGSSCSSDQVPRDGWEGTDEKRTESNGKGTNGGERTSIERGPCGGELCGGGLMDDIVLLVGDRMKGVKSKAS